METAGARDERRDRLLSTGGKKAAAYPTLFGSAVRISQSHGHYYEKPFGHTRYRYSFRAGALSMHRSRHIGDDTGREIGRSHGTASFESHAEARRDQDAV